MNGAERRRRREPFPGLRPFEAEQAHLFFGRDEQTDELLGRLGRHRFVAVVGSSGSGKSSLVRAGLLPASPAASWQPPARPSGSPCCGRAATRSATMAAPDAPEVLGGGSAFTAATLRRGPLA